MHYYWSLLIHVFEKIYRNYHNVNSTEKCPNSIKNQFGKHLYAQIMNSDAMINILSCLMLIWLHRYTYHWCRKHTQNVIVPYREYVHADKLKGTLCYYHVQKDWDATKHIIFFPKSFDKNKFCFLLFLANFIIL